jgi:hypothetical protein
MSSRFSARLERVWPAQPPRLNRRGFLAGAGAGLGAALATPDLAEALLPGQREFLTAQAVDIIHVIAGQSNGFNGIAFNAALDLTQSNFFQMYFGHEGTANHISPGGANDPLDNPDPTGITNHAIGNAVHFYRDWYCPSYGARSVVFVPCVYGGTSVVNTTTNEWGVSTAQGGAQIGTLTTSMISRVAQVRALFPSSKVIMSFELVEGDSNSASALPASYWCNFRAGYLDWILYVRSQFAAIGIPSNFPMILGRPTSYILMTSDLNDPNSSFNWIPANVTVADSMLRALINRTPNIGIADSVSPTPATNQSASPVHFDAAGQRTMAGRYFIGYKNAVDNALYPTSPVWDTIDVMTSAAGFPSGFTVGAGGSTISGDSNSNWKTAYATTPLQPSSSQSAYAEINAVAVSSSGNVMIGLCNQAFDWNTYLGNTGSDADKVDYSSACAWPYPTTLRVSNGSSGTWTIPGTAATYPTISAGDVIMFAVNRATGSAWIGHNGTWIGSGSDPATGAHPWITGINPWELVFLAISIYTGTGNTFSINGKSSQFTYSPPSGFTPWGI